MRDIGEKKSCYIPLSQQTDGRLQAFLWFHLLLRDPEFLWFLLPSHPFPSIPFPKPLLSVSWLSGGLALSAFKHLNIQVSRTGQQPLQTGPALPSPPASLGLKRAWAPATIRARAWESSPSSCRPHWSLTYMTQAEMSPNLDIFTSFKHLASDPKSTGMKHWL